MADRTRAINNAKGRVYHNAQVDYVDMRNYAHQERLEEVVAMRQNEGRMDDLSSFDAAAFE